MVLSSAAYAESKNVSTSFSIGSGGVNVSVPGLGPNINIKSNGQGQYQADFSVLKALGPESVPTQIYRVNPAPGAPSQLTDSDSFFKGVGGPQPVGVSERPVRTIQ